MLISECLLQPWEHDDKVVVYLNVLLPALAQLAKNIFKDHLPSGCLENPTREVREKCSTMKHNQFSESVFGYLDRLLRKFPNISVLSLEAYVMCTCNKTKEWLEGKHETERERLVKMAMRNVRTIRGNFKLRKDEIRRKHRTTTGKDQTRKGEREKASAAFRRLYIIHYGLWQSETDVDTLLRNIDGIKEKKDAVKAQLNFRKYVLKQNPPKDGNENVFSFSEKNT